MATNMLLALLSLLLLLQSGHGLSRKLFNVSRVLQSDDWAAAGATWYGGAHSAGSDGGSCGYTTDVEKAPFSSMVSAVGPSLYKSGEGCGVCYQVKCTENSACSGNPITVTVTDSCPGCTDEPSRFDLSGTAFGAMAASGKADQLRNAGKLQVSYKRVDCNYPGVTLTFHIDSGSNPYYFAAVIEYAEGDGNLKSVELQQAQDAGTWLPMKELWGALWELNSGSPLEAPFSLRLTEAKSGKSLVLKNVIPSGWESGKTYRSSTNFETYSSSSIFVDRY